MKKKSLYLSFALVLSLNIYAQKSVSYKHVYGNSGSGFSECCFDCKFSFCKDGKYVCETNTTCYDGIHDLILKSILSFGSYTFRKDTFLLKDCLYGYKMKFKKQENMLLPLNGYKGLADFYLDEQYPPNEGECDEMANIYTRSDILKLQNEIEKLAKSQYKIHRFQGGHFECNYGELFLSLDIDETGHFKLSYNVNKILFIYFEGKWKQSGNVIELYDANIDHTFCFINDGNKLSGGYLPGIYDICEFQHKTVPFRNTPQYKAISDTMKLIGRGEYVPNQKHK